MKKISKNDRIELANIYNTEGKNKMYAMLREKYLISNPSQVFACMKKATYLLYDAEQDCFGVKDFEANEANIFLDIESLCSGEHKKTTSQSVQQKNNLSHKSMDAIIQELIGDRLLTLSQYVSLDTTEKILRLDETTLKNDGYQLILH